MSRSCVVYVVTFTKLRGRFVEKRIELLTSLTTSTGEGSCLMDTGYRDFISKDLSILQYDVTFLSPDFLRKLRGFSKSFAYVGSVVKGNIG